MNKMKGLLISTAKVRGAKLFGGHLQLACGFENAIILPMMPAVSVRNLMLRQLFLVFFMFISA
jgi:hypothetical protein